MKQLKSIGGRVWAFMTPVQAGQANENEISFFDVKELYDAAFAEKASARASLSRFTALMAQAEALEAVYRAQLAAACQSKAAYGKAA